MNITLNTKALLASLITAIKVVPTKTALPILENVLVKADNDALTITASNAESSVIVHLDSEQGYTCAEAGTHAIPARLLLDIVKECNDTQVTLRTHGAGITVSWLAGHAELPVFNAEDYPAISEKPEGDDVDVDIDTAELAQAIASTVYAVAEELTRPVLTGLLFDITDGGLTLVGTDGHRLACCPVSGVSNLKGPGKAKAVISKKDISVLKNELELGRADSAHLSFSEKSAVFTVGGTTVIARCIVGKYPNWRDVIPKDNDSVLVIGRDALASIIRRVSVCASKASSHINLTFGTDLAGTTLTVTAQDLGYGVDAYERVPADYKGEAMNIGFKAPFVIDALNGLRSDTVEIRLKASNRAVYLKPAEDKENGGRKSLAAALLMPIAVQ